MMTVYTTPTPATPAWMVALIAEQLNFALNDEDCDYQGFALVGAQVCVITWGNNAEGVLCWTEGGTVLFEAETIDEMAAWLALQ